MILQINSLSVNMKSLRSNILAALNGQLFFLFRINFLLTISEWMPYISAAEWNYWIL